ncbi:MAG TPA: zinc ribbon domain-containing protein [Burkholderiales bacterium]
MPIYEYRCGKCGHEQDFLQKISERPIAKCPACGSAKFRKQLSAAGFQLKGSGWYATDFKGGKKPAEKATAPESAAKSEAKSETKSEAKSETKSDAKTAAKNKVPAATS